MKNESCTEDILHDASAAVTQPELASACNNPTQHTVSPVLNEHYNTWSPKSYKMNSKDIPWTFYKGSPKGKIGRAHV